LSTQLRTSKKLTQANAFPLFALTAVLFVHLLTMELFRLFCILLLCKKASALLSSTHSTTKRRLNTTPLYAVETVSLKSLENHEVEGKLLAESIAKWLDDEWMPQDVHVRMAESAKTSYITCREDGQDDVMDILMAISTDLDLNWAKYDDDAFVNAWDIGNYASDYLIKRSGNEGCECSSAIY
jgi:hypothetical protein